jgi:hypothetical protein
VQGRAQQPILYSYNDPKAGCLSGPGHQALFEAGGRQFIVFHAHGARAGGAATRTRGRYMYIAPLLWKGRRAAGRHQPATQAAAAPGGRG